MAKHNEAVLGLDSMKTIEMGWASVSYKMAKWVPEATRKLAKRNEVDKLRTEFQLTGCASGDATYRGRQEGVTTAAPVKKATRARNCTLEVSKSLRKLSTWAWPDTQTKCYVKVGTNSIQVWTTRVGNSPH